MDDRGDRNGGDAGPPVPLGRLIDHLEWANRRSLEAVRRSGSPEARRLLAHVLGAERVWLRRIERGDSSGLEIWPELSPAECRGLLSGNLAALRRLLRGLAPDDLGREVAYRNSRGTGFRTPVGEILLHVLLHGAHHRGQIARCLREEGEVPVNIDLITFVRQRGPDVG